MMHVDHFTECERICAELKELGIKHNPRPIGMVILNAKVGLPIQMVVNGVQVMTTLQNKNSGITST